MTISNSEGGGGGDWLCSQNCEFISRNSEFEFSEFWVNSEFFLFQLWVYITDFIGLTHNSEFSYVTQFWEKKSKNCEI